MEQWFAAEWWNTPVFGGTPLDWMIALGLSVAIALSVYIFKPILTRKLAAKAELTDNAIDDGFVLALKATRVWLICVFAASIGSRYLTLPDKIESGLGHVTTLALFLQVGFWLSAVLQFWVNRSRQRALEHDAAAATSLSALAFVARVILWAVIVLLVLDNFGVNITALVAGLGVGGVAVALAVQNILGDLFASLSIIVDKPFVIGDFIIVDDYMGTVEHVGLKTTRIRSLGGEQIVFSNGDLLKTRIRNYKRMYERRVVFSFGVAYGTSPELLEQIPPAVKKIVEDCGKVRFDRAHFQKLSAYELTFEVVYWVLSADYNLYMDIQQKINLELIRLLAQLEISIPFPTQQLYIESPIRVQAEALKPTA
jgi:small-conductance mechanosensitive channel